MDFAFLTCIKMLSGSVYVLLAFITGFTTATCASFFHTGLFCWLFLWTSHFATSEMAI